MTGDPGCCIGNGCHSRHERPGDEHTASAVEEAGRCVEHPGVGANGGIDALVNVKQVMQLLQSFDPGLAVEARLLLLVEEGPAVHVEHPAPGEQHVLIGPGVGESVVLDTVPLSGHRYGVFDESVVGVGGGVPVERKVGIESGLLHKLLVPVQQLAAHGPRHRPGFSAKLHCTHAPGSTGPVRSSPGRP